MEKVVSAINKLDDKKDQGPMGIPVLFVKHNVAKLAPILTKIYNCIMKTGSIPATWKKSFIQPIPKKGKNCDVSNYRGIAMQSVLPKVLDRLLTLKLYEHLDDLLPLQQHGFRAKKSTTTNLLEKVQYMFQHLKKSTCIDVIYFDYSKAFDQVVHGILARKLLQLSTPLPLFRAVMSFVTNRTYQLKVDGKPREEVFATTSSVPQGSHCGPVLFQILCYDITTCVRGTTVQLSLYADDTTFLRAIYDDNDRKELQQTIDKLERWSKENFLRLNPAKTIHVSYTRTKARMNLNHYYVQRDRIQTKDVVKDLGVTFDSALTFKPHIDDIQIRQGDTPAVHCGADHKIVRIADNRILLGVLVSGPHHNGTAT